MTGIKSLMARVMYGGGLRVMEVLRLRIQDIDFANGYLMIRDAKGGKDRTTLLAPSIVDDLKRHLDSVRQLFDQDVEEGVADVYLPNNLAKKYPKAGAAWEWQYVFPSQKLSVDPRSGKMRRHHMDESGFQKGIRAAKNKVGIYP